MRGSLPAVEQERRKHDRREQHDGDRREHHQRAGEHRHEHHDELRHGGRPREDAYVRALVLPPPCRVGGDGGEVMGCAFLVQRASWTEFSAHVQEQAKRYDELEFEQTGPWPPYDFVRMELGA